MGGASYGKERFIGEISKGDQFIRITSKHILLLDSNRKILSVFENRNIQNFIFVDGSWIYALRDPAQGYDNKLGYSEGNVQKSGFYIYDVARLLEGYVE